MTVAICIRCGAEKWGAINLCYDCGFQPRSDDDIVTSMALSDHHVQADDLRRIGDAVRQGNPLPAIDPQFFQHYRQAIPSLRRMTGITDPNAPLPESIMARLRRWLSGSFGN